VVVHDVGRRLGEIDEVVGELRRPDDVGAVDVDSALPTASQRRYRPNWSVVEDGISTMFTVWPVRSSKMSSDYCRISLSRPKAPETMARSAADTAPPTSSVADVRSAKSDVREVIRIFFPEYLAPLDEDVVLDPVKIDRFD
jgi:hypothetical protein